MDKIDLFEKLVRVLAIKPFNENEFCLEEAEVVIK